MHSSNNNQLPVKRLKSKLFPGSEPTYPEPLKIYSKINSGRIWNSSQYDALPELSSYMPFKVKVDYPIPKAHSPQPKARDKMPPIITNEIISNLSRNNEMYKESRVIKLPKRAMTPIQKLPLPIQEPRITSEIGAVYLTHENNRSYIKKIPIEIAYLSPTLKHIHKSSEPFLEGHQGFISLSLTSRSAFIDILAYMDHLWDPKSKSYIVNPECAVELIDHAFYLELPGLVDLSATCIANNADLNLLKNIPTLLIEVVLKKMNIINLFIAEQRISTAASFPKIDCFKKLWLEKLIKIQLLDPSLRHVKAPDSCRDICIEYLLNQVIGRDLEKSISILKELKARQIEKLYIKSSNEITRNKLFKEYIAEKIVQKLVIIIDEYKNGIRLLNDEEWIHIIANESIDIEFEIIQCNKYTNTVNAVNAVLNTMLTTLVTSDARQLRIQTSTLKESRKSLPKSLTGFRLIFKNHGLSLNETESVIKKMEEFNLNSIDATNNLSLESIAPQISYLATMLHINLEKTILDSNAQILFFENLIQSESRLVSLNISETVISPNQKASRIFSEYISKTRTLKILNISGNSYSTVCTHDILTGIVKNRSINSLDISRIDLISNIELLSNFRSKNFVYLNISHTNLGPRQTQQFLSNLGPTNHLKIMGLNCSIESIKSIMCRLYENLVRFEMPCVEFMIDDEGCCEIISTCCLMQALRFIDLSYHGCGRATAFALSRVFEVGMNLHVKLNGCVGIGEQEVDIIEGNGKGSLVLELFSSSVGIEKRDKVNNLNLGLVIMC